MDFCCLECYFYVDEISSSAYWVFIIGSFVALITARLNRVFLDCIYKHMNLKELETAFFFFFGLGTVTIVLSVSTILLIRVSYLLKFLFNYVWEVLWYFIIVEIIGSSLIIIYAGNGCNNNA